MQGNKVARTLKSFQLLKAFWQSIFKGRFAGGGGPQGAVAGLCAHRHQAVSSFGGGVEGGGFMSTK